MNPKGFFITGTDTNVGKTVVTAALLAVLRAAGKDAVPMKPIQTGCTEPNGVLVGPDLEFCLGMTGLSPGAEERRHMEVYAFKPACSPHLAAAQANTVIEFSSIAESFRILSQRRECVLVEGAGGVMVPITGRLTMLDLMVKLGLPVVLVARPGLGTVNHTLLSLRELRRAGLPVSGVVLCQAQPGERGWIERDNHRTIERLGDVPVLGRLPYIREITTGDMTPSKFLNMVQKHVRPPAKDD